MVQDRRPRKEEKEKRKGGKRDTNVCWRCGKNRTHISAICTWESWNRSLNAADEDKGDISEEVHEDEDELHAWCLLTKKFVAANEERIKNLGEKAIPFEFVGVPWCIHFMSA